MRAQILKIMKLKKGDNVIMLSGKDRGKTGQITRVLPGDEKVLVSGLNLIKRHLRARKQGQKGQIVSRERFVSAASAGLVCKSCGKPTRVGYSISGAVKTRICRKCKAEL